MFRTLPRSPDLAHLRDEAKSLELRTAAGDREALAFVEFHKGASVPGSSAGRIELADVQFALARAYGFKSWPRLKAYVEAQAHTPLERGDLLLKELFGDNWALLQELYERRDELPSDDIFIAAGLGNAVAVESLLTADSSLAKRLGGPKQTQARVLHCSGAGCRQSGRGRSVPEVRHQPESPAPGPVQGKEYRGHSTAGSTRCRCLVEVLKEHGASL
jgi:hypothetical protein